MYSFVIPLSLFLEGLGGVLGVAVDVFLSQFFIVCVIVTVNEIAAV